MALFLLCTPEGIRVKHSVNGNSIKVYDKQGSVLRVETTINRPKEFRVYRTAENKPDEKKSWRILRKGLADLPRRAQISQKANERYLEALGAVSGTVPLFQWVEEICRSLTKDGRKYRGMNRAPADAKLLESVNRGEFAINGFRNRDLRHLLFEGRCSEKEKRRAGHQTSWAPAGAWIDPQSDRNSPLRFNGKRTNDHYCSVDGAES